MSVAMAHLAVASDVEVRTSYCYFDDISDNVILDIFKYLSAIELIRNQRVCRRWKRLGHDFYLWRKVRFAPRTVLKRDLLKLVNHYFNVATTSIDICGAWRWHNSKNTISLSDNILKRLAIRCPNLEEFMIEEDNLSDVNLCLLPKSIEKLSFTNCDVPVSCFLESVGHFTSLKSLQFRRCPCINEKHVTAIGRLGSVERLECYGCYRFSQAAIEVVAAHFPNLRALALIGSPFLGDEACRSVASKLTKLQELEIDDWIDLTPNGVEILKKGLTNLKFLSVKAHAINDGEIFLEGSRVNT